MSLRCVAALAGLWIGCAAPAAAQTSVSFIQPERYTDVENRWGSGISLRVTLGEMRRLFTELGNRILQPGQTLSIDVLDIDLAGLDQPGGNQPYGLRVVTDITPPRFVLRYALKERGRTLLSAQETVTDLNFLTRYGGRAASSTTFYYERELIRDWLQSRFVLRRPPRG